VAAHRRRSPLTAASGSTQIAYHGNSHAVHSSSAIVLQPAATRQSAPRAVRHSASASTARKPAMNRWRHQPGGWVGTPIPNRRAVSAGTLCAATSCCCSPIALRKPSACTPKPTTPTSATAASAAPAPSATRSRSLACAPRGVPLRARARGAASTRNGSTRPAVTFTPTPAASAAAAARGRERARGGRAGRRSARAPRSSPGAALNASASASASISSVSLCAPPTASANNTGFRPTNAAAHAGERPSSAAARATSATAPRLDSTAIALNAHSPPASPSGTTA
jgi:hypothetical protein